MAAALLRSLLPLPVSAKSNNKRKDLCSGDEIGLFSNAPEEIQSNYLPCRHQPDEKLGRLFNRRARRGRIRFSQAGLDKRGGWRRQLRSPGEKKTQGVALKPGLGIIEGENGALVLAPMSYPCCLKLFCCQWEPSIARRLPREQRNQILWNARWISFQEYRRTIGRP
jgi:hypothetical protein